MRRFVTMFSASVAIAAATPAVAGGEEDYAKYCVSCHGKDGKGKTKMGERFNVKDFTDPSVQSALTDEKAFQNIADGVMDAQTGKVRMPARKDKLAPEQIKDLVKVVRAFSGGG